jgi:uroporphyrinogen-III synthase
MRVSPRFASSSTRRHRAGAELAQTCGTRAPTVLFPVGGRGIGTGTTAAVARIVVTRPAGQETALVDRLRAVGHDVVHVPLVAIEPLGNDPIDVTGYDWVVLTSVNGAHELRRRMCGTPAKVAAIGHATADAFGRADLIAGAATQEGLLAALPKSPGRVLFASAEGARRLLPETLRADVVALYRTVELEPREWPPADLVVLMSPSAARALARVTRDLPAVSIGPETTRAAVDAGVEVVAEAATSDFEGVVLAVEEALAAP